MARVGGNPFTVGAPYQDEMYIEAHNTDVLLDLIDRQLRADGLSLAQIDSMSLSELEGALNAVDHQMMSDPQDGLVSEVKHLVDRYGIKISKPEVEIAYQALLYRKATILRRMSLLRPQQELNALKDAIEKTVQDPDARAPLLESIDTSVSRAKNDAQALNLTVTELRETTAVELTERKTTILERRSKIFLAWLTRESVATIIGALLLLVFGVSLIVAMFIGTTPTEIITSAFLLILGYFFGQATKRDKRE